MTAERFPKDNLFKVGDFVTVKDSEQEHAGVVLEVRGQTPFPYRVGGAFVGGDVWDAWFPNWQISHDFSCVREQEPAQS